MVTIYFDKQLFSYLFNAKEEKYIILRDKILSHKDDFVFLFSDAHLLDLQQDSTDIKYKEMDFMQSVVGENCLICKDSNIVVANESPRSAFSHFVNTQQLSWLDNFDLSQIPKEQYDFINNAIDLSIKDFKGELELDWITKRTPIHTNELNVNKDEFSSFLKFIMANLYDKKDTYKAMRDVAMENYNPTKITADGDRVFNDQLSSSPLGLSFINLIKAVSNQLGMSFLGFGMVYFLSYTLLDLLGICKEPRKKVKIRNMQTDSFHSFFGTYCDCIVSDDEGVRDKSKILYRLFNVETQVYSIDEFIEQFDKAINDNKKTAREYFGEIRNDYEQKEVLHTENHSEYTITQLKAAHKYFGYFNHMFERESKDGTVIMLHKNINIKNSIYVQEVEVIVNRIARIFNSMGAEIRLFDKETDWEQIRSDNWRRGVDFNDAEAYLAKFKDIPALYFLIEFKNPS